jgi:hypothetical protein
MVLEWREREHEEVYAVVDRYPVAQATLKIYGLYKFWVLKGMRAQVRLLEMLVGYRDPDSERFILDGQPLRIEVEEISSNNNFITMWLKKSITFDIFIITNKYTLLNFRLQCFPFLIRNVSPCYITKYMQVTYIRLNFSPCFFQCYIFKRLCGSVIYYVIIIVDGFCPLL